MPTPTHKGLSIATGFFLLALVLCGVWPLWIDEIIQLRETRNTSPAQLIASLPRQPGAAPLGYLIQQTTLHVTGYSARWARFPSALFVSGAVFVVALLAAELGLARPWLAAGIFALFPVTLRYASESRVYSQALFFSTLATLLFAHLLKNPGWRRTALYCLALVAAVYTQPYAVFVGVAHTAWALFSDFGSSGHRESGDRKIALQSALAVTLAVAAFLPWYLWTKATWSAGVSGAGLHFVFSAKTPLMLFRELAGAGYWGAGLLLILCAIAVATREKHSRNASLPILLLSLIAVPIVLALTADAMFGYFVATRQIIWVLPAVAILAASASEWTPRLTVPLTILLALFCVWQNIRFFTAPREDWQLAADTLSAEVEKGACLVVIPPEQLYSYEFFRPRLARLQCPAPQTVVAFSPYATSEQRQAAISKLNSRGYTLRRRTEAGKSQISLFSQ